MTESEKQREFRIMPAGWILKDVCFLLLALHEKIGSGQTNLYFACCVYIHMFYFEME